MIEEGIYPYLSNEDYHSDPAISRSGIMKFLESPYKYWAEYINLNRPNKESTKQMDFGSAFHTLILEPHLFKKEYVIYPEIKDKRTKKFQEFQTQYSDKIILSKNESDILNGMYASLWNNKQARGLIEGAIYESSYFWKDEHTEIICKARPDILRENAIIDLKTCSNASTRAYQRSMGEYGYHIQGAMMREGIKQLTGKEINTVINICVEKTYPYEVGIKIISESALDIGHAKFKQALLDIKRCIEYNNFTGYEPEIVNLPAWFE